MINMFFAYYMLLGNNVIGVLPTDIHEIFIRKSP